jgi:deoxyribodipyrimidine photolyase-related protein
MESTVIFPHQLFLLHLGLSRDREDYLVEDQLFFSDIHYKLQFHKKKIILHHAAMQVFMDRLISKEYKVFYMDFQTDSYFEKLKARKTKEIYAVDVVDHNLEPRIAKGAAKFNIHVNRLRSPCFLTQIE